MSKALPDAFSKDLLGWYRANARDLPWRRDPSPYAVAVSEFMLQQTTVETVLPYFARFMALFPDWEHLARASDDAVLKAWEGLGYYRRAVGLHRLARAVVARGGLPEGEEELLALPGIGPYTAGAIRCFAFGKRDVAIDANVRRVASRMLGEKAWDGDGARKALLAALPQDAFAFNQAMMDLGALVCRPRRPDCSACPVADGCMARLSREPEAYGRGPGRRRPVEEEVWLVAVVDGDRLLVRRREGGLLGGLWGLVQGAPGEGVVAPEGVLWEDLRKTDIAFSHTFTHRRWRVRVWLARGRGAGRWVDRLSPDVALGGPDRKAIRLLVEGGYI